jgi:hypothetical protein
MKEHQDNDPLFPILVMNLRARMGRRMVMMYMHEGDPQTGRKTWQELTWDLTILAQSCLVSSPWRSLPGPAGRC